MKNLTTYINESISKSDEKMLHNSLKSIIDCATCVIDYFNQEGVKNWDEQDWIRYVEGEKEPKLEDIVEEMEYELEEFGDKNNILPIIKKYSLKDYKLFIDSAIMTAAQEYIKNVVKV